MAQETNFFYENNCQGKGFTKKIENFQKVLTAGFPGSSKLKVILTSRKKLAKTFFSFVSLSTESILRKNISEKNAFHMKKIYFFNFQFLHHILILFVNFKTWLNKIMGANFLIQVSIKKKITFQPEKIPKFAKITETLFFRPEFDYYMFNLFELIIKCKPIFINLNRDLN